MIFPRCSLFSNLYSVTKPHVGNDECLPGCRVETWRLRMLGSLKCLEWLNWWNKWIGWIKIERKWIWSGEKEKKGFYSSNILFVRPNLDFRADNKKLKHFQGVFFPSSYKSLNKTTISKKHFVSIFHQVHDFSI